MSLSTSLCVAAAVVTAVLSFTPFAHALTLVDDGRSDARVFVATDAPAEVQNTATELVRVIQKMSGAKLPIMQVRDAPANTPGVVLGSLANDMGLAVGVTSRAKDAFRFAVKGNKVLVVSESPRGLHIGVMRFLETLGCGWYVPGDVGEVIPVKKTVAVPDDLDRAEASDSINRRFWYGGKNRVDPETLAWLLRINGDYRTGAWSHAYGHLIPKQTLKEHPEYGSLSRGKRTTKQLCTTNPEVIRLASETLKADMAKNADRLVFPAGPNDGGNLCECAECAKLDTPGYLEPSSGKPACSSRIFKFASDIADITSRDFPNRDLGILVYSEYSRIPKKIEHLNPNVFPMIAPIRRCRIHGPGNPICEMNRLWGQEIRGWAALGKKLGFYMYNYNLADTLLPFSKIDFYRRTLALVKEFKVEQLAWTFETIDSWAMMAPSFYLSARMSWTTDLDVDAEMDRFYDGFYGAAAEPMARYWKRLDNVYAMTAGHAGSSYAMHKFWTPPVLEASRTDINEAMKLAANPREAEAVAMAEAGLRCAELFMQTWNALAEADFATAAKGKETIQTHVKAMAQKPAPHWAHDRYAYGYFKRFVGLTVDGGAAIVKQGGRVLVKLPDVWRAKIDPDGKGAEAGWAKPEFDTSGWKDMGTMSTSWVDEGLTWYHGDVWYRTEFTLPADLKQKDLRLWFGGFDYNADVTLNGHALGEKKGFVKPVEYGNISPHVRFGGRNVLAVRCSAGDLAEIGTGGIMMPVVIYEGAAAATPDGKPAKPAYEM